MKTTIEVNGYEIVINSMDEVLTVTAMKEGETVEEFELSIGEEGSEMMSSEDEIQDFEDFEEESQESEESEESEEDMEDMGDEGQMEEEEGVKLESFQSFINKKRK